MHSEAKRKEWFKKAEQVYRKLENFQGLVQAEAFREFIEAIDDEDARAAVEMQVWYWLRNGKEATRPMEWLTANWIFAATFAVVYLVGWGELGVSPIWSGTIALTATVVVRFVFRMFDRGFLFRRLFTACVSSGLFLIMPAQLQFNLKTSLGPVSWGGSPSWELILVWVICMVITAIGAFWEHRVSNRT